MAEEQSKDDRPLVQRWLEDQREWQKTMLGYMDSMANNEEFLQHLGNAMRGSLLAGKPYPGTEPVKNEGEAAPAPAPESVQADERLDRILFTLHEIQGQLNDLHLTVERLAAIVEGTAAAGGEPDNNKADATQVEPEASSVRAALHERSARGRSSRPVESASASSPKMRRSQPRSALGRRGDAD